MQRVFEGKSVLVTGAGGSIGSELCRLVMSHDARRLVLVSLTEGGLYTITKKLEHEYRKYRGTELVPRLGDAGDIGFMIEALKDVDIVVHAAAHKHVPICEANPIEAIANNVFGTRVAMDAAQRAGVKQFCLVSSDKAVKPTSIMGATKRLAELLAMQRGGSTHFFTVRFGNVMDSAGSVLPLWREQIASGGPITLTDERCTRYFMSIADAVELISQTIWLEPSDGTYVFDMGEPVNLMSLAKKTILRWANGRDIDIKTIGLRAGEKLTEELHYGGELKPTIVKRVFRVEEPLQLLDRRKLHYLALFVSERRVERARELLFELVGSPVAEVA